MCKVTDAYYKEAITVKPEKDFIGEHNLAQEECNRFFKKVQKSSLPEVDKTIMLVDILQSRLNTIAKFKEQSRWRWQRKGAKCAVLTGVRAWEEFYAQKLGLSNKASSETGTGLQVLGTLASNRKSGTGFFSKLRELMKLS